MSRNWKKYLKHLVAWTGVTTTVFSSLLSESKASVEFPTISKDNNDSMLEHINYAEPLPMAFTIPLNDEVKLLIAGHRSHRSHSSHRSHYSSRGGGGYYVPSPSYSVPSYTPSYSTPSPSPSPSYSPPSSTPSYSTPSYSNPALDNPWDSNQLKPLVPAPLVNCTPDTQSIPSEETITNMKVQVELMHQGYYMSTIDGIVGPVTKEALRCFQQNNGLPATGEIDAMTLRKLKLIE